MSEKKYDLIGGSKKWLYSLMGKVPPESPRENVSQEIDQEIVEPQEDSIASDMKMFKDFFSKSVEKAKTAITPFAKKSTISATKTTQAVSASVDNKFIKTIVRSFIIVLLAIVLIFIAVNLFKMLGQENGSIPTGSVSVTPVPIYLINRQFTIRTLRY